MEGRLHARSLNACTPERLHTRRWNAYKPEREFDPKTHVMPARIITHKLS